MASNVGNYLCHALSVGGCEQNHIVNALGYGALVLPALAAAMLLMHRGPH